MFNNNTEITIASFFSGYGGLEMGISHALGGRTRCIAYVERDVFPVCNLVAKIDQGLMDDAPIFSDITTFPYRQFRGLVDIACGGVPCQPHSHAGKRKGGGDERFLFDVFIDGLDEMRPGIVFIENVEGLLSSKMPDGTLCIKYVLAELERIGYCVENSSGGPSLGIFSASEVGAPHQRKRVFILAYTVGDIGRRLSHGNSEREVSEQTLQRPKQPELRDEVVGRGEDVPHLIWPSHPGHAQYGWEPPRVAAQSGYKHLNGGESHTRGPGVDDSQGVGPEPRRVDNGLGAGDGDEPVLPDMPPTGGRQTQSPLGGNSDGLADGMDFPGRTGLTGTELEEIYGWMVNGTNKTDELRLCGNGVCPQTAEKAFRVLYAELYGRGQKS